MRQLSDKKLSLNKKKLVNQKCGFIGSLAANKMVSSTEMMHGKKTILIPEYEEISKTKDLKQKTYWKVNITM